MTKSIGVKVLVSITFCLILLNCFAGTGEAAEAGKAEVIKVGIFGPLTGGAAPWGNAWVHGLRLPLEEINNAGGIRVAGKLYKFEVLAYDNKYSTEESLKLTRKLIYGEKVRILCAYGGAVNVALRGMIEKEGVLCFTSSMDDRVPHPDYPLSFNACLSTLPGTQLFVAARKHFPKIKRAANCARDDEVGRSWVKFAQKYMKEGGITPVGAEYFDKSTKDFTPVLLRVIKTNPDLIDLTGWPAGALIKQGRALGYKGYFAHFGDFMKDSTLSVAGKENVAGTLMAYTVDTPQRSAMIEFKKRYIKTLGEPYDSTAFTYPVGDALVAGIRAADSLEARKIAAALTAGTKFKTPLGIAHFGGKEDFGINNQLMNPLPFCRMNADGQAVLIEEYLPKGYLK